MFALSGFYNRWWRYVSTRDMWTALRGVTLAVPKGKIVTVLAAIGIPGACLLHGYVGFLFGALKSNPWWSTPLMPIVFLFSAIVSGIALVLLTYMVTCVVKRVSIDTRCVDTIAKYLARSYPVPLVVWDLKTRSRLHPVTLWCGLLLVLSGPARLLLARTDAGARPVRLLGVGTHGLVAALEALPEQLRLGPPVVAANRERSGGEVPSCRHQRRRRVVRLRHRGSRGARHELLRHRRADGRQHECPVDRDV